MDVYQKRRIDEDSQFSDFEVRRSWDYHIVNNSAIENAEMQLVQILKKEFLSVRNFLEKNESRIWNGT